MTDTLDCVQQLEHVDKTAYDEKYNNEWNVLFESPDLEGFVRGFEETRIRPYYLGGAQYGYVNRLTVDSLFSRAQKLKRPFEEIVVLDAGCAKGELSFYLAAKGFRVIGVEISESAVQTAKDVARKFKVDDRCTFLAESLEETSIEAGSVDFVIGHSALHHFIKYSGVSNEFQRLMKPGAEGFFSDTFGENKFYHLFHDKEKMRRLGDVILTKELLKEFFDGFEIELTPADWLTMFDKLYRRVAPVAFLPALRRLSRIHFSIDRMISPTTRASLYCSGTVFTWIRKLHQT